MMNHLQNRDQGPVVQLPDRTQANFSRIAAKGRQGDYDLEQVLVDGFKKRTNEVNSQTVRSKNELVRFGLGTRDTTHLLPAKDSVEKRNHYILQLRHMHVSSGKTHKKTEGNVKEIVSKTTTEIKV